MQKLESPESQIGYWKGSTEKNDQWDDFVVRRDDFVVSSYTFYNNAIK